MGPVKGTGSLGAEITGSCVLPDVDVGSWTQVFWKELQGLLAAELSPQGLSCSPGWL